MNIFNIIYKYIIALLFIFIFVINNFATSQSMDDSRRAMQQSKDIMSLSAENKMCQNFCSSSFRSDALNNPSNANRIFDRCLSGCQENYQSKMSCIQSQLSSQYSPSKCNKSFKSESQNFNESNSSDGASNFIWLFVFCIAVLFFFKRKYSERFSLNFSYIVNSKNKINNLFNTFYLCLSKLIFVIKNLTIYAINFFKVRRFILIITFLIPTSVSLIYYQLNEPIEYEAKQSVEFLINPNFEHIFAFSNGLALIKNKDSQFFINTQGKKVFDNPSNDSAGIFSEGLIAIAFKNGSSNDYGFVDTNGNTVISPRFSLAKNFSEGLAAVVIADSDKWGFINKNGDLVIKPKFEVPSSFNNGMADVTVKEAGVYKKGYIDTSGNFLIPAKYLHAHGFNENLAPVFNNEIKKWGFVDKQGELVVDYNFDSTFGFSEGLAAIEIDNKRGFVNIKGDIQIKPSFVYINYNKLIQEAYYFQEGLSAVWIGSKEKGKVGFINKKGDIIIKPIYDEAKNFFEGLAAVRIGNEATGKWGFINKKGEFIIKPTFDEVSSFNEGFASVGIGGEYEMNGKFEEATVLKSSKFGIIRHPVNNFK